MSVLPGFMGSVFGEPLTLSQINFTAPLDSVPLPRDFKIPEGSTLTFSTTTTGKPVVHISGPPQGDAPQHWAPEHKENQQVASNSKAYKVVLTNGDERVIDATEVQETGGRLKFVGAVKGHEDHRSNDVVASFLSENVAEYGVIPVPEEDKVGENTYRLTFVKGGTEDIRADRVLYTKGSEKGTGQFTFVTGLRYGESRTEFLLAEDKVETIKRLSDNGADVSVPAQDGPKTGGETLASTARELPTG